MRQIYIKPLPAMRFQVVLAERYCTLALRQKGRRLYLDLETAEGPVCAGAVCVHGADVIQSPSPNFTGSLHFYDRLGKSAPQWEELNSRYLLLYLEENEATPRELMF
jgi:hypothetical protein